MATDSPVQIHNTEQEIQGQPQSASRDPHDGTVTVRETHVVTDRVILDPNDPLAVQVPKDSGASSVDRANPLGEALAAGTPEEQFGNGPAETTEPAKDSKTTTSSKDSKDKS